MFKYYFQVSLNPTKLFAEFGKGKEMKKRTGCRAIKPSMKCYNAIDVPLN